MTETLTFRIDPTWLTNILRTLWLEQSYGKAFKIVDSAFPDMTLQDKFYIITGRKKLVYAKCPDAEARSIFELEGDDWKPSGVFAGMKVATFTDVLEQSQFLSDNREAFKLLEEISVLAHSAKGIRSKKPYWTVVKGSPAGWISSSDVTELICRLFPPPTSEQWNEFWKKYGEEVRDIKRESELADVAVVAPETMAKKCKDSIKARENLDEQLAAQWGPATANNIDVFLAHQRVLDKRSTPAPDPNCESEDGWILPDGKFYGCGYMEHIWLADRLGKEEKEAEKAGWIKISHGVDGRLYIQRLDTAREPTQKQIDTMFTWCEKHKAKLPDWAGGHEQ